MRKILVVEDNETLTVPLEIALQSVPSTEVVVSADEALQILSRHDGVIAALVTDLQLPRMSGFELVQHVRSLPEYAALPIVVMTGHSDTETPPRLSELGIDAFFSKRYSPNDIYQWLEKLLNDT